MGVITSLMNKGLQIGRLIDANSATFFAMVNTTRTNKFKITIRIKGDRKQKITVKGVALLGFYRIELSHSLHYHSVFTVPVFANFWRYIVNSLLHNFKGPYFDEISVKFNTSRPRVFRIDNGEFDLDDVATDEMVEACFEVMKVDFLSYCAYIERMI